MRIRDLRAKEEDWRREDSREGAGGGERGAVEKHARFERS